MKHFSVLLVDDNRAQILEPAEKKFAGDPKIRLRVADHLESALKLLKSEFFHLALIDARLYPDGRNLQGLGLLRKVKELRPSCERVLMTTYLTTEAEQITLELHPLSGSAQSLLNAGDPVRWFKLVIEDRSGRWLSNPVEVVGSAAVADTLRARLNRGEKPATAVTDDEIDYLVSRLFGQGQPWNQHEGVGIARVELDLIKQGFSPAAVLKARCFSTQQAPGIWCVLKIARRHVVEQELVRYSRYVRYRLALHHRVELLGCEFADNLGVLCYNFASGSPEDAVSLSDLYLAGKDGFFQALDDLLSPGKQGWYAEQDVMIDGLGNYFSTAYGLDTVAVRRKIREYLEGLGPSFSVGLSANRVTVCGATFELPDPHVFNRYVFRCETPGCIVHGDMHCDNILVVGGNRPNLIDFYSVQNGPRALDFATLEGSIRLLDVKAREGGAAPRSDEDMIPELTQLGAAESPVWRAVWPAAGTASAPQPAAEAWMKASIYIGEKAKANHPNLSAEEYAATCLMWAMRLFKVAALSSRQRMRLLVWISSLVTVLTGT